MINGLNKYFSKFKLKAGILICVALVLGLFILTHAGVFSVLKMDQLIIVILGLLIGALVLILLIRKFGKHSNQRRLKLPADNKNLYKMIDFLKSDMKKYNVSPKKQFNLVSAVEEIFANIAYYAYEKSGEVIITTFVEDGVYYVQFSDKGKKYNPLKNKNPDISSDLKDRKIGGLGIFLAKKLSDKISYTYKNNQNILTIGINL